MFAWIPLVAILSSASVLAQEAPPVDEAAPPDSEVVVNPSPDYEYEATVSLLPVEDTDRLAAIQAQIVELVRGTQIVSLEFRGIRLSRAAAIAALLIEQQRILQRLEADLWLLAD